MSGTDYYRGEVLTADELNTDFGSRIMRSGDTMTGPLILFEMPQQAMEATPKQYVDSRMAIASPVYIGDTPPANPTNGTLWFDSVGTQLYVRYNDPNSNQWVPAANATVSQPQYPGVFMGDSPPSAPQAGTLWFDTNGSLLYIYYNDGSSSQWIDANNVNANLNAATGAPGPFLPLAGGTMIGGLFYTATSGSVSRTAQDRAADVINVLDYIPAGATDYSAGVQAALNAVPSSGATVLVPKLCPISGTLLIKSNTLLRGCGPGTGFVALAGFPGGALIKNQNFNASTLTDHDISFEDLVFDYGPITGSAASHCLEQWYVTNVRITNCTFQVRGNGNATACVACYNTHVQGCTAYGFVNCAYDHWMNPVNGRVVNCYAESANSAQFVNWNPDNTGGGGTGNVARGFVLANNEFLCTNASATNPIQLEPLGTGTSVRDVVVSGNVFRNVRLALRGDTRGVVVTGNTFEACVGGTEVITAYTRNSGTPTDFVITSNNVLDPATTGSNAGVIRIEATNATISGNRVSGTTYGATPGIYTGSGTPVLVGNSVSNGVYNTPTFSSTENALVAPRVYVGTTTGPSLTTNGTAMIVNGQLILSSLPTSVSGLPVGTVWNNGGVLCVA